MRENVAALLLLYIRPVAAISRILDHGRLWFAIVAALGVSVVLHSSDVFATAMAGVRANMKNPVAREQFRQLARSERVAAPLEKMAEEAEDETDHPSPLYF